MYGYGGNHIIVVESSAPRSTATLMKTGQTTSYRTGDDGDLEAGRNVDFTTLAENNPFGNTNRFTDELGGQTYTKNIEEIYRITQNQYNQGYVDFIALQSAKRNYLSSQTNLIKLNQSLISSTVSLYKALGGGWSKEYLNEIEKL